MLELSHTVPTCLLNPKIFSLNLIGGGEGGSIFYNELITSFLATLILNPASTSKSLAAAANETYLETSQHLCLHQF